MKALSLIYQTESNMKKSTTITIINDAEGKKFNAFKLAAKFCEIPFNVVSPSDSPIMDISVKYNEEHDLFLLGSTFTLYQFK